MKLFVQKLPQLWLLLAFVSLQFIPIAVWGQPYYVFQKQFWESPTSYDLHIGHELQQTSDGGFIIGGVAGAENGGGEYTFYLLKTDNSGVRQWTAPRVGETGYGNSVQQTTDGGYIIAGYYGPLNQGGQIMVVKHNSIGSIMWSTSCNITSTTGSINVSNAATSIRQTSDGGYILTGYTKAASGSDPNLILLKIDAFGSIQWIRQWKDEGAICRPPVPSKGKSVIQTSDGGYIIAAELTHKYYSTVGYSDPWGTGDCWGYSLTGSLATYGAIIKTDASGNELWRKTLSLPTGSFFENTLNSIQETSSGDLIATGFLYRKYFYQKDLYLTKISSSGATQWCNLYRTEEDEIGYCVKETSDNGFIIAGMNYSSLPGYEEDALLLKVTNTGAVQWAKAYGWAPTEPFTEYAYSVVEIEGEGYAFSGFQQHIDPIDNAKKVYFVKTSPSGNSSCNQRDVDFSVHAECYNVDEPLGSVHLLPSPGSIPVLFDVDTEVDSLCGTFVLTKGGSEANEEERGVVNPASPSVEFYPNIVNKENEDVTYSYSLDRGSQVRIVVTDVTGREVYSASCYQLSGSHIERINTRKWSNGIYIVGLYTDGIIKIGKFVIRR